MPFASRSQAPVSVSGAIGLIDAPFGVPGWRQATCAAAPTSSCARVNVLATTTRMVRTGGTTRIRVPWRQPMPPSPSIADFSCVQSGRLGLPTGEGRCARSRRGGAQDPSGHDRADHHCGAAVPRHRQHRHLDLSCGRRRRAVADEKCRHHYVFRQAGRPRQLPVLFRNYPVVANLTRVSKSHCEDTKVTKKHEEDQKRQGSEVGNAIAGSANSVAVIPHAAKSKYSLVFFVPLRVLRVFVMRFFPFRR